MIKLLLPKDQYIKQLDDRNWVIGKIYKDRTCKGKQLEELPMFYFPNLEKAWRYGIDRLSLLAEDFGELNEIIDKLVELKNTDEFKSGLGKNP